MATDNIFKGKQQSPYQSSENKNLVEINNNI